MAREATTDTTTAAGNDRAKELEAEIAALRQDISSITETLGGIVKDTGRTARREMRRAKDQVTETAEDAKDKIVEEYEHYEDELQGAIRERPITSVLIAAGVGFLLSKIL